GAGLQEVDFAGAREDARRTINTWVEKETHDKIKELLKKGVLTDNTRLVLTNAIYFKGDWPSQFKKDKARDEPFHVNADKSIPVPLMNQTGAFKHFADRDVQVLELPYVSEELSMVVVLPKKIDGLSDVEKNLTADQLAGWLGKLHKTEV